MSVALIPSQAASDSRGRLGHAAQRGSSRATGQQLYRPDDALGAMLHAPSETVKPGISSSQIVTLPSLGPIAIVCAAPGGNGRSLSRAGWAVRRGRTAR